MLTPIELHQIQQCFADCEWDPGSENLPEEENISRKITMDLKSGRRAYLHYDLVSDSVKIYRVS